MAVFSSASFLVSNSFLLNSPQGDGNIWLKSCLGGVGSFPFSFKFPARGWKLFFPLGYCPLCSCFLLNSPQGDGNLSYSSSTPSTKSISFLLNSPQGDGNTKRCSCDRNLFCCSLISLNRTPAQTPLLGSLLSGSVAIASSSISSCSTEGKLSRSGSGSESEEIKMVRIFQETLSQIGLWTWQHLLEVGNCSPHASVEVAFNLKHQDIPAPAVFQSLPSVPESFLM